MTALERTKKVINDLQNKYMIAKFKRILYQEVGGKEIFVISLDNSIVEARKIRRAIEDEFQEITLSFTCVKEVVAFTIKS